MRLLICFNFNEVVSLYEFIIAVGQCEYSVSRMFDTLNGTVTDNK